MQPSKKVDIALLLLRLVFGATMLLNHGWGKVVKLFTADSIEFSDPLGVGPVASLALASFAEFLCAGLLVIGLFTRWVAIPLIITMSVIIFMVNWGDSFKSLEKAILFLAAYLAIFFAGPGWYSVDQQLRKP